MLFIQAICLFAWGATSIIAIVSNWLGQDVFNFLEFSIETMWIIFSMITFFLGYFAIHEPDLFRVPQLIQELTPIVPLSISAGKDQGNLSSTERADETIENLEEEMARVAEYMNAQKPYINSKLSLVELSHHLKLPPYLLSKIQ